MATYPSDPFLVYKRLGTKDSPFVQYNSPIRVTNGKVYLTEIPNKTNHVTVSDGTTSYAEMTSQASLSANNNYYVDYENGVVYFDPSHNDKLLTFSFLGEGIVSIPASRIYTQSSNGTPTQDLQDMIDNYNQLNGTDLYNLFDPQTGHKHSGAAGDAPPIDSQYVTYDNGLGTVSKVKDTLDSHAAQLADIAIDVLHPPIPLVGAKGDGTTDDTTVLQNIINKVITTGGIVFLPPGNYKISSPLVMNTSNAGKKLTFKGAGIGVTNISITQDIDAIQMSGFLIELCNFAIVGTTGSTGSGIHITSGYTCGRVNIEYVQVQTFKNGLFNEASFDQMWIDKCLFSGNSQYGIYFNETVTGGGALLNITNSITNNNGSHGIHITTSNIYGHITIKNHESVANTGRGVSIASTGTYSLVGVTLEQVDIEAVPSTADCGLYLQHVQKFTIIGGQINISSGQTVSAAMQLDSCTTGFIINPWFRNTGDGFGTPSKYIYVTNGSKQIYLLGAAYFGTPIDFTVDSSTDKSQLYNLDIISTNVKKYFFPATSLVLAQGNPALTKVNDVDAWLLSQSGVDTNPAISLPFFQGGKIKKITVYWFNNGTGTGAISFQFGYRKTTSGNSLIGVSRTYDNIGNISVGSQNILTKTTLTPTDTNLMADFVSLWIIRNTSGTDTLTNQIGILGVEIDVE